MRDETVSAEVLALQVFDGLIGMDARDQSVFSSHERRVCSREFRSRVMHLVFGVVNIGDLQDDRSSRSSRGI